MVPGARLDPERAVLIAPGAFAWWIRRGLARPCVVVERHKDGKRWVIRARDAHGERRWNVWAKSLLPVEDGPVHAYRDAEYLKTLRAQVAQTVAVWPGQTC